MNIYPLHMHQNPRFIWLFLFFVCALLETTALYYQYILDYAPCVSCIHVRLWVALIWLLSLIGIVLPTIKSVRAILLTATLLCFTALIERSWALLGTERGFLIGSCNFDIGLPNWLALDQWLPFIFKVETSCGYTPIILANITMAEALLVVSSVLWLFVLTWLIYTFKKPALSHH